MAKVYRHKYADTGTVHVPAGTFTINKTFVEIPEDQQKAFDECFAKHPSLQDFLYEAIPSVVYTNPDGQPQGADLGAGAQFSAMLQAMQAGASPDGVAVGSSQQIPPIGGKTNAKSNPVESPVGVVIPTGK